MYQDAQILLRYARLYLQILYISYEEGNIKQAYFCA